MISDSFSTLKGYYEGFTQRFTLTEESSLRRKEARSKVEYQRVCKICGNTFTAKSGNARYCGCHLK